MLIKKNECISRAQTFANFAKNREIAKVSSFKVSNHHQLHQCLEHYDSNPEHLSGFSFAPPRRLCFEKCSFTGSWENFSESKNDRLSSSNNNLYRLSLSKLHLHVNRHLATTRKNRKKVNFTLKLATSEN